MLLILLVTLLPGLTWAERRETLVSTSSFSTKVLHPLRSSLTTLVLICIASMIFWDFSIARLPATDRSSGFFLEAGALIEKALPELIMAIASLMIGRHLMMWDSTSAKSMMAGKYGVVNTDEVELGQIDEGGENYMEEVNNYDPDKLGQEGEQQRVRLE